MSDRFDITDLPYAIGQSPFHLKGNHYLGELEYIDRTVPGGRAAVLARIEPPEVRSYCEQRFIPAGWYDVFPQVTLTQAAAQVMGQSYAEFAQGAFRAQAKRDISGLYKFLLRFTKPEAVMERMPRVATQYFDFVSVTVEQRQKGDWLAHITGTPKAGALSYMAGTEPFVIEALTAAGARNLRHEWLPSEPGPPSHGLATVRLTRHLRWEG